MLVLYRTIINLHIANSIWILAIEVHLLDDSQADSLIRNWLTAFELFG